MQKFKEWLRPFSDFFLNGFSDTFQLLLDNFLGDYLEDPKQLNMTTLIKGVEMLKLNKAFINELLGQSLFRLEEAYIESIKVANLKFEARGLKLVFAMSQEINMEQLKAYIEKTDAAMEKEKQKLAQLNQLREEVYKHTELEQSCDLSKSMRPQTGLIQFLGLVDTLLSNSSLTIKDINIVLKAENGKEYQFHIHQTNVDFQKPDLNNLLFISFGINLIELRLEKEQIAQIQNALKFEMVLETRNGRVSTKLDGKMSSLDLVVNKKQIQSLLQTVQNYLTITDELNKCILQLKEDPGVEFDDDDDQEIGKTEASLIDSLPSQMKPRFQKIIANPQYIDSLNLNLQQSLATHPIPKQQEQQFIEFSQSIFNSCQDTAKCSITNSLKNQTETLKFQFDGIRIAVCENTTLFPQQKGRFFSELESHFFIEVQKIVSTFHKDKLTFQIQSIGAHKVRIENNIGNTIMQSQDVFKSCKENPRLEFYVTPVIMMGLAEVGRIDQDFAVFIFDKLQEECKINKAIDLQMNIYKGNKKEKFYMITGQVSDIIASLNHELLLQLFSYLPQNEVQQLPKEEVQTPCMFGFDLKIPYVNLSYVIKNKPIEFRIKEIKVKQSPVKKFAHKRGVIEPFEGMPGQEDPLQFICITFFSIWVEFQGQNIITIGQHVLEDKQIFPLFFISFQNKTQTQHQKDGLEQIVKSWQQNSEILIRGSIPMFELILTQDLLFWLVELNFYFEKQNKSMQKAQSKVKQSQIQKKSPLFLSLTLDSLVTVVKDSYNKELFLMDLQKVSIIQSKSLIVLTQNILLVDCQIESPLYNGKKPQQKHMEVEAEKIMIYRTSHFISPSMMILGQGSKKYYSRPLEVNFEQYLIKLQVDKKISVSLQNICVRIPDYTFQSFKKLTPLIHYFNNQKLKQEESLVLSAQILQKQNQELNSSLDLEIRIKKDLFLDIFPVNETEELKVDGFKQFKHFSTSRALLKISEFFFKNEFISLSTAQLFVCRQNGFEFQCPIILAGYFEKLQAFQFTPSILITNMKYEKNNLNFDQLQAHFRYDVMQTLLEMLEEIQVFLPKTAAVDATNDPYTIDANFQKQLIPDRPIKEKFKIQIGQIQINLEEGHTFYQMPIYFDVPSLTFDDELRDYVCCTDAVQKMILDTITIILTSPTIEVELYNEGQIGLKIATNLEIKDAIANSKFKLIMSPDFENFPKIEDQVPVEIGLILENQAYTARIALVPMRLCLSGALLQFFFNFQSSQSWITKASYEDQIQICKEQAQKSDIWLKNLQISETGFNVTYDSEGLKMDDFFKGLLKLSSFCNLQIPISPLQASIRGTAEEVVDCVVQQLHKSLGSKISIAGKALSSLEAFSIVTNLVKGMMSLILKPFQEGLVAGTRQGVSDFSNSVARALLKTIRAPSSAIVAGGESVGLKSVTLPFKYMKERSQIMLDKMSSSGIPKRFLKKY